MDMWSKKWTFVKMKIVLGIILLQVVFVCGISAAADTEDSDLIRESRKLFGGYRITPKFCKPTRSLIKNDPRSHGPTICMFNHECIQRNGVVVGACMDGFLFGTCCQLQGTVENSVLLDNSLESSSPSLLPSSSEKPTNAAAISYENYGGSNFGEQNEINNNDYYVNNVAVQLSNPSSGDFGAQQSTYFPLSSSSTPSAPVTKGEMYLPPSSSSSQYFSPELPSFISTTSHYQQIASSSSTEHMDYITENSLNKITDTLLFGDKLKGPFTHSDITHPEADSVILEAEPETGFYGEAVAVEDSNGYGISSTSKPIKSTFAKPAFKPKPTKPSTEKYVLVHTITNEKQPSEKPSTGSDMESIESIILMLNDTKTGPQYANDPVTENIQDRESTTQTRFPTTSSINYDKYGPTSFYITTKLPASTRRPTTTSITTNTDKKKVPFLATTLAPPTYGYTAISSSLDFQKPKPTNKVTTANQSQKPLVTSYVSSTVIPKRPNQNKGTTRKPIITRRPQPPTTTKVTKKPVTTRQPTRQPPSTIIVSTAQPVKKITPTHSVVASTPTIILVGPPQNKPYHPVLSIIHDNTVQISGGSFTERPHPTVHITPKPTNLPSSTVYSQPTKTTGSYNYSPFITKRPTHSTTALVYNNQQGSTVISDTNSYYGSPIISSTSNYGDEIGDNGYETEYDTKPTLAEETNSNENDLVNFPPVRNPDFNTSNTQNKPINTPVFIEDDKLNNKMNLLVSKIVASLQDNFDELSQIVDESNVTTLRPGVTRRPVQKPSATGITRRPTTTGRPPQRTTTIKPQRPVAGTTTRRPATTRRPPTRRPVQTTTTKRPVTRITTRKPRPTRKTTTTTTTTAAPEEDEIIQEEEYPEEAGGGGGGGEDYTAPDFDTARLKCGVRPQVKSGRIVGGKSATFGEWPWQVLVRESTWLGLFTKNKCGGVLISKSYVVTAAHCQPGFLANLVAVFGEFDISGEFEKKRAVTKNVKRVIVHRNYDAATFENDLALLELESPIHYDTHIVPICMPSDSADFTGRMATVTGWGRLKYGGGVPSVLQEVQVPIIENSVCQEMFQTAGHNKKILSSFLCAGYANGQRDSCEGDSGGPLVLQRSDGRWELAGTVSHGIKCAAPYLPGVYMRTTFYKPWLESITGVH